MESIEVKDLRSGERWLLDEPVTGSFGSAEVTVVNVAEQGVQLMHSQPLGLATRARLWFRRGAIAVNVHGMIVWSHLSKNPNHEGKYLYHSGVRVESSADEFAQTLTALSSHHLLRRDAGSLERKRQRLLERERAPRPTMKILRHENEIPSDEILLIQQARERLATHPDEALKWYNRARYALDAEDSPIASEIRHRHDVLAVWEYLERTLPLATIVRVFERKS
jgi:hypothetical protein